jgi:hypothetical protein
MPWCEPCSRYFAPSAVTADGKCPVCGRAIEVPLRSGASNAPTLRDLSRMSGEKAPWHFKLLMTMLVLYLGWRLIAPFVD